MGWKYLAETVSRMDADVEPLRTVEVQVLQEQKPAMRDTVFGGNAQSISLIFMGQQWVVG